MKSRIIAALGLLASLWPVPGLSQTQVVNSFPAPLALNLGGLEADLSATGGAGQVLKQESAGAAITVGTLGVSELSGLGTGVATALGINVGSAGAFLKNNGDALSGTFSGDPDFSGTAIVLSGAASGTQDRCVGLTAGGVLATSAGACAAGSGDVVGPASAVDDRIAAFDGTTGKLIKDGGILTSAVLVSGGALGTPSSGVGTFLTGTASGLTAGNVTTNADLTGPITSTGNATAIASQTGTGSTFVMNTAPTIASPVFSGTQTQSGTFVGGATASFVGSDGFARQYQFYSNPGVQFGRHSANTAGPGLQFTKSRNATVGSHTAVAAADQVMSIQMAGSDGTIYKVGAQILGTVVGTVSADIVPTRLDFWTMNTAGSLAGRMRLNASGGLYLGTTMADPGVNNLTVEGKITGTGGVAAAGGFSVSPRNWASCGVGSNGAAAAFTDQTPVATEVYAAEIFVPANATLTGIAIRGGSVASGNVKVGLGDVAGNILKTSASTAVAGAAGVYQRIAFTGGAYAAAGPATYYVLTLYDNATVRGSTHTEGNCGAGKLTAQDYATGFVANAALAPTTFTTALGPVASLY